MKLWIFLCLLVLSHALTYDYTKEILKFGPRPAIGPSKLKQTREYIIKVLKKLNFTITLDHFEQETPLGKTNFTNIIADYKIQNNKKKLIFSAHYETKFYKDMKFVGATDSACPCGMVLELAAYIDQQIQRGHWKNPPVDFQMIFFDGEEAMVSFTDNDGLYGSRHLAEKWEKQGILKNIEKLILFDLLGHKSPNFYSYNLHRLTGTFKDYHKLIEIEKRLNQTFYFKDLNIPWDLTDDHIPFGIRGVPVLHLISNPYPSQWHTVRDTLENLDEKSMISMMKIFKKYLEETYSGNTKLSK